MHRFQTKQQQANTFNQQLEMAASRTAEQPYLMIVLLWQMSTSPSTNLQDYITWVFRP
jgi:hypothetical protein